MRSMFRHFNPLKNFRRGFATNSSSSHSFVYMKEPSPRAYDDEIDETDFNWNDFRLETIKSKVFYWVASNVGHYWNQDNMEVAQDAYDRYKDDVPELDFDDYLAIAEGYGVDHQSIGTITLEQARDPHVVVFGGNDNDGYSEERRAAITNDEVDWSRTPSFWADPLSRDDFPFQYGDNVRINGSKHVWHVDNDFKSTDETVDVSYWDEEKKSLEKRTVPMGEVVLLSSDR